MDNGDSWPFMAHGIPSPMWDAIPRPHPCRKEETSSTSTLGRGFRWRLAWSRTSAGVQRRKHQCIKELNAEYDPYKNRLQFMIRNCSLCSKLRWLCECETLLCAKRIHVINTSNNNKPTIWGRFIGSFLASPPYVSTSWSPPSWPCQATVEMRSERCCRVFFCLTFWPDGPKSFTRCTRIAPWKRSCPATNHCDHCMGHHWGLLNCWNLARHGAVAAPAEDSPKEVEHQVESCVAGNLVPTLTYSYLQMMVYSGKSH